VTKLGSYIRPWWGYIFLAVFIKFLGAVLELFIPWLMEIMLDEKVPAGNSNAIFLFGGLMLLCAGGCLFCNVLANRMSAKSSGKITEALRHDLFSRLEHLSARQMDRLTVSSAQSRLTSDTYNVNQLLARGQRLGIRAPILLIGGLVMMLGMDWVLALVLMALLPVIAFVVLKVTKTSIPLYRTQQSVLDKVVRTVQENITGARVIKALSKTEYEKRRFHAVNDELTYVDQKAGIISAITNPASTLTLNLGLTLVVLIGAFRVNSGEMQSGVIVAFLQYFVMILNAMLGITRIFIFWSKGEASAQRVAEVLETEADMKQEFTLPKRGRVPHIEFDHVSFSYTGIGTNISDLTFSLERGQTLGILGPTGSGKSTILNLLMRIYDADSGVVRIDGRDVRSIPNDELRGKFGVVFQNDFVTEGTMESNIRFFRELPEGAAGRAADHAQADFLYEKEGGMDAPVLVRGNNLSGGQKQRLLIARAIAADPEILVLDDASSALDYHTDARLRRALREHYRNVTTVLVAQRVSSLRHADLILVLQDGAVIGAGRHEVLMETCPEYRVIAHTQMGDGTEVS